MLSSYLFITLAEAGSSAGPEFLSSGGQAWSDQATVGTIGRHQATEQMTAKAELSRRRQMAEQAEGKNTGGQAEKKGRKARAAAGVEEQAISWRQKSG